MTVINPYLVVAHVPVPSRQRTLRRLLDRTNLPTIVEEDPTKEGPWDTFRRGILRVPAEASHVVLLCDDLLPCWDFDDVLPEVIQSRPDDMISLFPRNPAALDALKHNMSWYSSLNGAVQVTCSRLRALDVVKWADWALPEGLDVAEDWVFGMYAMCHGMLQYTTAVALVDHQNAKSLQGNDDHSWRRPTVRPYEDMRGISWDTDAVFIGRDINTHWGMYFLTPEAREHHQVHRRIYGLERNEDPTGATRSVHARVRDR